MDDPLYKEVTEAIESIFTLTARIDERVKMIIEKQNQFDAKIDILNNNYVDIKTKVGILETRNDKSLGKEINANRVKIQNVQKTIGDLNLKALESQIHNQVNNNRWKVVFDYMLKFLYTLAFAYILYQINFPKPPVQ